jgi:hypothetical protein
VGFPGVSRVFWRVSPEKKSRIPVLCFGFNSPRLHFRPLPLCYHIRANQPEPGAPCLIRNPRPGASFRSWIVGVAPSRPEPPIKFRRNFRIPYGLQAPGVRSNPRVMLPKSSRYDGRRRPPLSAGGEPPNAEPMLPLWKALVVQLTNDSTSDSDTFAGRVEHHGSGRREHVSSGTELLAT